MLRTETVNLPEAQRRRLHADFLANEQAYLQMRDVLLRRYDGQWVAVHGGKVIAAGASVLQVTEEAAVIDGHPYVARVGGEDSTIFRIRRQVYAYDATYQPFPLPRIPVRFSNHAETETASFADVIPDTGADHSLLPDADYEAFSLFGSPYFTAVSGGILGGSAATLIYRARAEIAGTRVAALVQPVADGKERIVGRDVLNQLRILFDGPAAEVVVDPD